MATIRFDEEVASSVSAAADRFMENKSDTIERETMLAAKLAVPYLVSIDDPIVRGRRDRAPSWTPVANIYKELLRRAMIEIYEQSGDRRTAWRGQQGLFVMVVERGKGEVEMVFTLKFHGATI